MEILNKSVKNASSKWITTWIFIYLSFFQFTRAVNEDGQTTMFSSGMDDTTTYQETSTHITITPVLSTFKSTSPAINQTISTTVEPTTLDMLNATVHSTSPEISEAVSTIFEPTTSDNLDSTFISTSSESIESISTTFEPTTWSVLNTTTVVTIPTEQVAATGCYTQKDFIPSGLNEGDALFPPGDDNYIYECPSIEVPIDAKDMGCFYISTNGYITNGYLLPYSPAKSEIDVNKITLMPLWTDIDTRFVGSFYYQIVDKYNRNGKDIIQKNINLNYTRNLFARFGQKNFDPVWVLKLTWISVAPFESTDASEKLTFQFILATDGTVTNMAYIYDDCQFNWSPLRKAIMGYVYPGYSYYHRDSLFPDIYLLGRKSNTINNTNGVWIFELSKQYKTNYAQKCLDWSLSTSKPIPSSVDSVDPCPCTLWQALKDNRYTSGPNNCFYLTYPVSGYSKVCCYLSDESLERRSLIRGNLQLYSAILDNALWKKNDYEPYSDCCLNSIYCSLYDQFRPRDYCLNYTLPVIRFTFGDPHIQTLDGFHYTFNGLGEFEHLIVYNATNPSKVLLKIQCRTKEVGTGGRRATAFSGFVIWSENVAIQISTRDQMEAVKIFGDNLELTTFYSNSKYSWEKWPFRLSVNSQQNNSYVIQHESQTVIQISLEASILQFSVSLGYNMNEIKTEGLLGTYNKNKTDDLTTPSGTIISANSTEEEIYYKFGILWRVNQSIFHYESSESQASFQFPNFVPTFLKINKTSQEYQDAVKICTEKELDCIYDYMITKKSNIAKYTKLIEIEIDKIKLLEGITSPVLNGSNNITVNVNQPTVHLIDVKGNNLTIDVIQQKHCNVSLSNQEVRISVELTDAKPVVAAFQVSNVYNMTTPLFNLTVMVCPYCNKHGICDKSSKNLLNDYEYTCKCNTGWRGPYCTIDARCDPLNCPCFGPDNNYTCTCPAGYKFVYKCVDINECLLNTTNSCSQLCENTIGSYKCSCKEGYLLVNKTECINRDECALSLHKCDQICKDTEGSYNCSCYPGYKLNGTSCIKETDLCNGTNACSNASGCTILNGLPKCFCDIGLTFNNNTNACEDINECLGNPCNNAECQNTIGRYFCKCPIGNKLNADGHSCTVCGHNEWGENCANKCSGANCKICNKTNGCICEPGYKGATCDEDIDECQDPTYCNTTTSFCENTKGSAICKCKDGFKLNIQKVCIDIDECSDPNACHSAAECSNSFGNYSCQCKTGYAGDGKNCTDIDECSLPEKICDHNCVNQVGSYSCTCRINYKLQDDRVTCNQDSGLSYQERLYIIIFGSLAGAIIAGILISLWCYCFGCCSCCACCGRYRRRSRYLSTLEQDRYRLRDAFGTFSSALRGRKAYNEPFAADSMNAAKYLEDWGNFSPYSENNRQEIGADNLGWEDFGDSSSSWGNIFNHFDNEAEFRIARPKIRE